MSEKKKFYTVWEGKRPGVYDSWDACKKQVEGYPQARYKSFGSRAEAEKALKGNYWQYVQKATPEVRKTAASVGDYIKNSLAVDAACSGNPGDMEYQGVHVATGKKIFHVGPLEEGTNNIGEFLALVHALALLKNEGKPNLTIYTDSRNAMIWVKAKRCNTKLEQTPRNEKIFEMIDRAEQWLAINPVTNPILKWETEVWGEIPADFGRK
jgi:ribonuclease HI